MALGNSHVDDNGMGSTAQWLRKEFEHFKTRFGGATRHGLPFTHTGVNYEDTDRGRSIDQNEFCQKLAPRQLAKERADQEDSPLTPDELTGFRAILGGLLWLCQTRLDLICDVVLRQQTVPEGDHC